MKYANWLLAVAFISYGHCIAVPNPYENLDDYKIVNVILQNSNLTQSEVDKLKLIGFGRFQEAAAAVTGTYAVYKTGTGIYELGSKADNTTKGTFLEPYFNEGILSLLSDKRFWAVAGAVGAGYGAYKVLYSRLERGILDQVKTFADMCENLDVYNYYFGGSNPKPLSSMGIIGKKSNEIPYNAVGLKVNAVWTNTSSIARQKAIDNLLLQANIASQLLSQLENTTEVQQLRNRINTINTNLNYNKSVIDYYAQQELQERVRSYSVHMQGAQQAANVNLAQQQASALWYGKISLAATALSNFAKNSLATVVYINDNKEKIAGGLATAIILPVLAVKALQTWYYAQ
jgi:hypothetical protein